MSNPIRGDKSFVKLLTLLMVIYGVHRSDSHLAEVLFEEEESPLLSVSDPGLNRIPSAHAVNTLPDDTCHVEFTVLKRAVGRCVKIGKTMRACISGTFVHPFHPEC